MQIKSLNEEYIEDAEALRDRVFPFLEPLEEETLRASLNPQKYIAWYEQSKIKNLKYWFIQDHNDVIGIVGLYTENGDKKYKVWLGWFCVDQNYRGNKIGSKLLNFAIQ